MSDLWLWHTNKWLIYDHSSKTRELKILQGTVAYADFLDLNLKPFLEQAVKYIKTKYISNIMYLINTAHTFNNADILNPKLCLQIKHLCPNLKIFLLI